MIKQDYTQISTCITVWILCVASTLTALSAYGADQPLAPRSVRLAQLSALSGSSQGSTVAMAQDSHGFVWIGTEEGLNRYDGQTIEQFERDPLQANSLSHNWIWSLDIDAQGRVLIGTEGGLNIYDPQTERFSFLRHDPQELNSISSDRVRAVLEDRQGHIWIGTVDAGLNRINPDNGQVTRYRYAEDDPRALPSDAVLTIYEDRNGGIWIGTDGGGLVRYEPSFNGFSRYQPNHSNHKVTSWHVTALTQDREGALWIGTRDQGLDRLDIATGRFTHFAHDPADPTSLSNNFVRAILQDQEGTLWVATDAGLNEWRPTAGGFAHYRASDMNPSSLSDDRLTALLQSQDGVLWISTYRGVDTWNYVSDAFTQLDRAGGHLASDIVTAIGESSDLVLWVGTYGGGLSGVNRNTGAVTQLRHADDDPNSLSSDRVMVVHVDPQDRVWAGTRNSGLNRYDPASGTFDHVRMPTLNSNSVSALADYDDQHLWVGTFGAGLSLLDRETLQVVEHYRHNPDDVSSIGGDRILSITKDRSGTLWIGTEDGGLNQFDPEQGTFIRFQHDPNDPYSLSSNVAWEVTETSDGSLWIATKDGGVNQWLPSDREAGRAVFKKWTKANGLRSNTAYGLIEDGIGQLWLSSNRGLTRINLSSGQIRHYDQHNGLAWDEFNWGARLTTRTGHLAFGGAAGATIFDPRYIRKNNRPPKAVIRTYSPLDQLGVSYTDQVPSKPAFLEYTDNYVAFEFAALDYTSPDKNEFLYRLQGFDQDWQTPGEVRRVTYANLSPGKYTFQVRVANSDGVWNEDAGTMPVLVKPAPWRSDWAYLSYTLLALVAAAFLVHGYRLRRAQELHRRVELEKQVQQRTSELGERNRELEELNQRLMETSVTDSLTGLYNRRYMNQFVVRAISEIDRENYRLKNSGRVDYAHYQQTILYLMMIDLDGFKAINDYHGHAAGDETLLQVKDELLGCIRHSDTVIRWGGDEFLIVGQTNGLPGITNLAERIRFAVSEHVYSLTGGTTAKLSCSIGAVPYPFAPLRTELLDWEQSLKVADACTYLAKQNGRDGWVVVAGQSSLTSGQATGLPGELPNLLQQDKVQLITSFKDALRLTDSQDSAA